jgi:hypothetical protein
VIGAIRRRASVLVWLLLAYPAADCLHLAYWNIHRWQRLRSTGREAPQVWFDRYLRTIGPYVPPTGSIGLVLVGSPPSEDAVRIRSLFQYALAPRQIVTSDDGEFVIAYGPASADVAIARNTAFQLVRTFGDDLRLFRRVSR